MPADPATALQSIQRATLGAASTAWRGLTAAQRLGWSTLGLQITRTDTLGQTYNLTGQQTYAMYYRNLTVIGGTLPATAPALSSPVTLASITVTATSV